MCPSQVTEDKENTLPQQKPAFKPAASDHHAAPDADRVESAAGHSGRPPPAGSSPPAGPSSNSHQAAPLDGASPASPRASPQAQQSDASPSAADECPPGNGDSGSDDRNRSARDGEDACVGGDVSDAEGSGSRAAGCGSDMWDEEDELDDAFRQERMAGLTQEASGHGIGSGGKHADADAHYAIWQAATL